MRIGEKVLLAWVALLFLAIAAFLAWPVLPEDARSWLVSEKGAGWAQAISSVLAIVSGAYAIRWQVHAERRSAARSQWEDELRAVRALKACLDQLERVAGWIAATLANDQISYDESASELRRQWRSLQNLMAVLDATPLGELPDARLRMGLVDARAVVRELFEMSAAGRDAESVGAQLGVMTFVRFKSSSDHLMIRAGGARRVFDEHVEMLVARLSA